MRYDRHGMQQYIPDYKETITVKRVTYEWHADATHVWVNMKGQSSAAEWSYNIDGSTLTYGSDEATQFVLHRDDR